MASTESSMGFADTRVAAVCEDWFAAEQEKKRLTDLDPRSKYHLIERTLTRRKES